MGYVRRRGRNLIFLAVFGAAMTAAGISAAQTLRAAATAAPVNRIAPSITGDDRVGGKLECGRGSWNEPVGAPYPVTYKWLRDGQAIAGSTSSTYAIVLGDLGKGLRCDVTATNGSGSTTVSSSTVYPATPAVVTSPVLTGDPRLKRTLTCSRGVWDDDGLAPYATSFSWYRNGVAVTGQTGSTYTLVTGDVNQGISCRVAVGTAAFGYSSTIYPSAPEMRTPPELTGDPRLGGTLSCSRGSWDDQGIPAYAVTRQWLRNNAEILGATGESYIVGLDDVGDGLTCKVRAEGLTDANSSTVYATSPVMRAAPHVQGDPRLGRKLTCTRGTWDDQGRTGDYGVSYEWYRNSIFIGDSVDYVVTGADIGSGLRCQVIAEELTTASSQTVYPTAPDSLTTPRLFGDARLHRALGCSRGDWDDADIDAYPVAYQWRRNGVVIDGATGATLTLGAADVNQGISCRVTAAGLTSATTSTVYVQAPANQMSPSISGDPYVGKELTCSRGAWDDPAGSAYAVAYQWFKSSVEIAGATGATYKVADTDLNSYLHCRVRAESVTTASSSSVLVRSPTVGPPPVNFIPPAISGDRRLGGQLSCSRGSWNDAEGSRYPVTYRWRRNSVAISGATSATYTVTKNDISQSLLCEVTANQQQVANSSSVAPTAPDWIVSPTISGDPRVRRTLTCGRGDWDDDGRATPYAVTYRWLRGSVAIPDATAASYVLKPEDVGTSIHCEVRAETLTAASSASLSVTAPKILLYPSMTGNPRVRQTLSCTRGTWDDIKDDRYAVAYQWLRSGQPIADATKDTNVTTADDIGKSVDCNVRAEDRTTASAYGSLHIAGPQNRILPRITGRPRLRQTLSCSRGDWDDTAADRYSVTYQWLRNGVPVDGATAATYLVGSVDVNKSLYCRVRAEDATDSQSASVYVQPPEAVISPTISGLPRLYRTLTCSRGEWDDTEEDRYAVKYQWYRGSELIAGATATSYPVQREDVNKGISCRVRSEELTTASSNTVYPAAPRILLAPVTTGQPHLRGVLACSRGNWDDSADKRYAISHQWYRSGRLINGATEPTYVVSVADLNRTITCSAVAEGLAESFAAGVAPQAPHTTANPTIEGIAHPRRELSCLRGEWNDSPGERYAVGYQWRRGSSDIPGADTSSYVVTADDVGLQVTCTVTAEGSYNAYSNAIYPTWEPLRMSVLPDADAVDPSELNGYTVRVRNANPVPVMLSSLALTLPGGFSYRPGTTTGALAADPTPTGPGGLTLSWGQDFQVPAIGDAVLHVGTTSASTTGDHFASATAQPLNYAFVIQGTGQTARVTVEGPEPAPGACTVVGTAGPDVLAGTAGADVICGLGGDDVLRGADGADQIWGGDGDDRIEGGDAGDTLRGGEGADVFEGGAGGDTIRGGGDLDTVTYAGRQAAVKVTIGSGEADDGAVGEADSVASDVEIVRGGSAGDALTGGPGRDELYGRAGDDTLIGGEGAGDLLDGGDGNDTLIDADDLIDRLICGGGADRYAADLLDRIVGCETPVPAPGVVT